MTFTPRFGSAADAYSAFPPEYPSALGDAEPQYWLDLESRFREAWREDKIPVDSSFYLLLSRKE
jgi:hypothetical protein